jgi:hypothetical protein
LIAGAAGDYVVPANFTFLRIQFSKENDVAIVSLNSEGHRGANDIAGGGEVSRSDRPRTEAGRVESNSSGDPKAPLRAGGSALSKIASHVERCFPGGREGATQGAAEIKYLDASDASLVTACRAS